MNCSLKRWFLGAVTTLLLAACGSEPLALRDSVDRSRSRVRDDRTADVRTSIPSQGNHPVPRSTMSYEYNGVPWLAQWEAPWGQLRYGGPGCGTLAESGCAPAAIAMVLRYYDYDVSPVDIASIAVTTGARACSNGTDITQRRFLDALARRFEMAITISYRDITRILALLNARQPVIVSGVTRGFTEQGALREYKHHYLVLTGVDTMQLRGRTQFVVRVNDPGNRSDRGITYMTIDQFERKQRFVHFAPTDEDPVVFIAADRARRRRAMAASCKTIAELQRLQRGMRDGALSAPEWFSYGNALARCAPAAQPWRGLGVRAREQFVDAFVNPFVNRDLLREQPFAMLAPQTYRHLITVWAIDG